MILKKFLLTICLILVLPVWADEQKESVNPFALQPDISSVADFDESIFLFDQSSYDNNLKPCSVYSQNNASQFLQGGVQMNENSYKKPANEQDLIYKSKNKKAGKLYVGNLPASSLTRGVIGGYSLYKKDKFGIRNEYLKNLYKQEFTRNSVIISPELYLNKNVTLRAFHSQTVERKGFEEGVALEYGLDNSKLKSKKLKRIRNLRFEVSASAVTNAKNDISQRFGFNTRYNF